MISAGVNDRNDRKAIKAQINMRANYYGVIVEYARVIRNKNSY